MIYEVSKNYFLLSCEFYLSERIFMQVFSTATNTLVADEAGVR